MSLKPVDSAFLVYAPARFEYSACTFYRCEVPLRGLYDLGLANVFFDRGKQVEGEKRMDESVIAALLTTDIDLFYAQSGGNVDQVVSIIHGMKAAKDINGQVRIPPSVVYDIDDNLDWVHPYNTSFAIYGTHDRSGKLLSPGDTIYTHLGDGTKVPLWEDKKTVGEKGYIFDVERNANLIRDIHRSTARYDGFTTPSSYLGKYLKDRYGYPEPYVFPNSIILKDHYFPRIAPHEGVRIFWQGGASHLADWYPLRGAIKYIADKYPQVTFVIWGVKYSWITDVIPEAQLEYYEWKPYDAYKVMRHSFGCDINLCPLTDDEFGRSKSCIKWYEGSLGPSPEATLAADCLPYNDEIVDGQSGLLYKSCPNGATEAQQQETAEQFAANLELLITNPDLRKKLATNAQNWIYENRLYEKTVPGLFEYYKELRVKRAKDVEYAEDPPKPSPIIEVPFVGTKKRIPRAKRKAAKKAARKN